MKPHLENKLQNVNRLNSNGFTMLEMLFSFSIFCVIASFIPLFFQIVLENTSVDARLQKMEWEVFVNQLGQEVQMSENVEVMDNTLVLFKGGETISYEKYGATLRRLVAYRGHEVVLQNVENISFNKVGKKVHIKVVDRFNQSHEINVFSYVSGVHEE